MGMTGGYAGFLHTRKGQNVCIAGKLHGAHTHAMSAALHKAEVGRRLRIAIEGVGRKPAQISAQFDVSPSKLGNWMRGDHYPDPWFLKQFCDHYGLTADWFYRGLMSGVALDVALKISQAERESVEE